MGESFGRGTPAQARVGARVVVGFGWGNWRSAREFRARRAALALRYVAGRKGYQRIGWRVDAADGRAEGAEGLERWSQEIIG
jgi:hypothetical protein